MRFSHEGINLMSALYDNSEVTKPYINIHTYMFYYSK